MLRHPRPKLQVFEDRGLNAVSPASCVGVFKEFLALEISNISNSAPGSSGRYCCSTLSPLLFHPVLLSSFFTIFSQESNKYWHVPQKVDICLTSEQLSVLKTHYEGKLTWSTERNDLWGSRVEPSVIPGRHLDEQRCKNSFWSIRLSAGLAAHVLFSYSLSISSILLCDGDQKIQLRDDP